MIAYDASEWHELFVASAGASAALAGLVFVAVSINVEQIMHFEGLPERALETVLLLLSVLLVSIIGLIPGQSHTALGVELLGEGLAVGAVVWRLSIRSVPQGPAARARTLGRLVARAIGTVPFLVGGVSVLAEAGGGLHWTAGGIIGATAGAVANAWVLLIEIRR